MVTGPEVSINKVRQIGLLLLVQIQEQTFQAILQEDSTTNDI